LTNKFVVTKAAKVAIRTVFHGAKDRAKNGSFYGPSGRTGRRKAFRITQDYLISLLVKQNGLCALSGVPLTFVTKRTIEEGDAVGDPEKFAATNVSIDRIDPRYGYVYGNIQLVTSYANRAKGEMKCNEFLQFCLNVVKFNYKP